MYKQEYHSDFDMDLFDMGQ